MGSAVFRQVGTCPAFRGDDRAERRSATVPDELFIELSMNAEEKEIYDFLQSRPGLYISVNEISKYIGRGRQFEIDRNWARPILRRMEMEGHLEANPFGEYRVREPQPGDTNFRDALRSPGSALGDTTIIRIDD